jgi:hypothetical protein
MIARNHAADAMETPAMERRDRAALGIDLLPVEVG